MAYIPTSKNPHITTAMLQQALYMVLLKQGPEHCEQLIKNRIAGQLVLDSTRKKLLYVGGCEKILLEINLADIISISCLDANKKKENRHRVQVITKGSEIFEFYVDIPYQWDPLPFIWRAQQQINYVKNPAVEVRDNKAATVFSLIACIVFFIWTIVDWTNGGTFGWGIITLFLSICSGIATYYGFSEWGK